MAFSISELMTEVSGRENFPSEFGYVLGDFRENAKSEAPPLLKAYLDCECL